MQAMYDLLAEEAGCGDALQVVGDGSSLAVKGLRVVEASSEEEALSHFFTGMSPGPCSCVVSSHQP